MADKGEGGSASRRFQVALAIALTFVFTLAFALAFAFTLAFALAFAFAFLFVFAFAFAFTLAFAFALSFARIHTHGTHPKHMQNNICGTIGTGGPRLGSRNATTHKTGTKQPLGLKRTCAK